MKSIMTAWWSWLGQSDKAHQPGLMKPTRIGNECLFGTHLPTLSFKLLNHALYQAVVFSWVFFLLQSLCKQRWISGRVLFFCKQEAPRKEYNVPVFWIRGPPITINMKPLFVRMNLCKKRTRPLQFPRSLYVIHDWYYPVYRIQNHFN